MDLAALDAQIVDFRRERRYLTGDGGGWSAPQKADEEAGPWRRDGVKRSARRDLRPLRHGSEKGPHCIAERLLKTRLNQLLESRFAPASRLEHHVAACDD